MSFDNHYQHRKDRRKQYQKKCEKVDRTCRPGGSCPWCQQNRKYRTDKRKPVEDEER